MMICEACEQFGGFEGEPEAQADFLIRVTAPQAEAEANGPEFQCAYHAARTVESYVGFGWAFQVELNPGEMQKCCRQQVSSVTVVSPTVCQCGRTLVVRDRAWGVAMA